MNNKIAIRVLAAVVGAVLLILAAWARSDIESLRISKVDRARFEDLQRRMGNDIKEIKEMIRELSRMLLRGD